MLTHYNVDKLTIHLQASEIFQSSGEKSVLLRRTHVLNLVRVALNDLDMVLLFASTLNTCLAVFAGPLLVIFMLFFICLAVGGSIDFPMRRLIRGFRAPSGVACWNCMLGFDAG